MSIETEPDTAFQEQLSEKRRKNGEKILAHYRDQSCPGSRFAFTGLRPPSANPHQYNASARHFNLSAGTRYFIFSSGITRRRYHSGAKTSGGQDRQGFLFMPEG